MRRADAHRYHRRACETGRDPRDDAPEVVFSRSVLSLDDLSEGMELTGTVRNVVDFGAFVDIGVKQDGLVHISQAGGSVCEASERGGDGRRHRHGVGVRRR